MKVIIARPCSLKIGVKTITFISNHKKKYLHLEDELKQTKSGRLTFPNTPSLRTWLRGVYPGGHPSSYNPIRSDLSYVCTVRLIGQISYPGECDLKVHPQKHTVIFSRAHFVTFLTYITCTKIRNRPD